MFHKVKTIFISLTVLCSLGAGLVISTSAAAMPLPTQLVAADFTSDACSGVDQIGSGNGCSSDAGGTISKLMKVVLNILSVIVGFAAVVMIIISGFRLITANGDSSGIASARSALIYALIGVVIVFLAQTIVHFVLGKVGGA